MPTIRLGHSPDSDDAFMFYALAAGKVKTGDRRYEQVVEDISSLNLRALAGASGGELDVTAVSIHAYAHLASRYVLLPHGGSVGDGYGPLLVSRDEPPADPRGALAGATVGVPGTLTTAYLAVKLYQPAALTRVIAFDALEEAARSGEVAAAVLIHEGQLTYADAALALWQDLGAWWGEATGLPLPLGGNAVRRDLGDDLVRAVSADLRASIAYALAHRAEALDHAQRFARGMDRARTDRFVGMYVNDFTLDYGERGRQAIERLLDEAYRAGLIPQRVSPEFVAD